MTDQDTAPRTTSTGTPTGTATGTAASHPALEGHYWERARRGATPWVLGAVGLAALGAGQLVPLRHHMEADLRDRSAAALQSAGLPGVTVEFTGRDGTLTGTVASPADIDRALRAVRSLDGVRVAEEHLTLPATTPAPAASPAVKAVTSAGTVTLTGTVGSEAARQALVTALAQTFGGSSVTDQLTVDPSTSDAGVADVPGLLAALGKGSAATVDLAAGKVTLTGTVADQAAIAAASNAATAVTGDPGKVANELTIGTGSPSSPSAAPSTRDATQQALSALPRITFENGSDTLTPGGLAIVHQAADILKADPGRTVSIEGFTDDLGDWDVNKELSTARAQTVLTTLVASGVEAGRLSSFGWSEEHPKVPNTSAANRAVNRRVEFAVR